MNPIQVPSGGGKTVNILGTAMPTWVDVAKWELPQRGSGTFSRRQHGSKVLAHGHGR